MDAMNRPKHPTSSTLGFPLGLYTRLKGGRVGGVRGEAEEAMLRSYASFKRNVPMDAFIGHRSMPESNAESPEQTH
ncbi:hypothetical protein V1477_015017 [Vespula maculifrons]|uniref:Uncharacterized protein n=2 Tax=Vespula TaxID=7451 RepID=A0A834JIN5_VESVU|nr:hypothetical protein HZH66_010111 [Vespula vulgaris]